MSVMDKKDTLTSVRDKDFESSEFCFSYRVKFENIVPKSDGGGQMVRDEAILRLCSTINQ